MNFGSLINRTGSPATTSRASSPVRNAAKKPADDVTLKNDKAIRRYAATIERTLATWEVAPEEWADYIAFLSRLLKAVQSSPPGAATLPYSDAVASKLAQCLNPGLPSGVHQKALEVYAYIFSTFGKDHVSSQLHNYLPGLFPLLSFAALSVRPALYGILEDYVVCLQPTQLRPVLKSFILSMLPALEDESSEDFDRALTTMTRLEHNFLRASQSMELASFYWQSIFLSVITSPSRRQGALNYLVRRLPRFARNADRTGDEFPQQAEAVISPEPGLLIRAFACGLSDPQMLIQRGFLDLLTTHLPLDSSLLQARIEEKDFQLMLSSAMSVLLRRDMSLNRRVWQWLLGPEPKEDDAEQTTSSRQLRYISTYGLSRVETCLLDAFTLNQQRPSDRAKPFRIGLSLMDRWEIGGNVVPKIFLPAIRCAWMYSRSASQSELNDFMKSAKLFFDGVESKLIWSRLLLLLDGDENNFQLLLWILKSFNVREEEMTTIHAPLLALHAIDSVLLQRNLELNSLWHSLIVNFIDIISSRLPASTIPSQCDQDDLLAAQRAVTAYYADQEDKVAVPYERGDTISMLIQRTELLLCRAMTSKDAKSVARAISIYIALQQKFNTYNIAALERVLADTDAFMEEASLSVTAFTALTAISSLLHTIGICAEASHNSVRQLLLQIAAKMVPVLLSNISPDRCKHNVEAVRVLWRLDSLIEDEQLVQASVQGLVTDHTTSRKDSIRTFLVLWNLSTVQAQSGLKSPMPGMMHRAGSILTADHDRAVNRSHVLRLPLMTMLDTLRDPSDIAFDDVNIWLNSSTHTEAALMLLFEQLRDALNEHRTMNKSRDERKAIRAGQDGSRALIYILDQFSNVLEHAKFAFWNVLAQTQLPGVRADDNHQALSALIEQCLMLLPGDSETSLEIHLRALTILNRVLSSPANIQAQIRVRAFGTIICERLLSCIVSGQPRSQSALLDLSMKALHWQCTFTSQSPARTKHARKLSLVSSSPAAEESTSDLPVNLLIQLLKAGLSSPVCRPYLDVWVHFTEEVLPLIGATITTVLIPVTEVICQQITQIFEAMLDNYATSSISDLHAPEVTIARLLDSLDYILRDAHSLLTQDHVKDDDTAADSTTASTVLSNMTPNLFKTQGPPSKTANANQRLTAILASKDVAQTCIRIWLWASNNPESTDPERQSSSTITYVALRLRNKARHMLEEIFNLEPLESLEVVAAYWTISEDQTQKDLVLSLLHVLRDLRPKNTVPAILDALCSRTNPSLLTSARQSTLTSELTPAHLILFFSAYLSSLEDDALEEVWSDCSTYFRDVLSNPLPHRQILPALIWIVFQLAQKLENTNYGERKRMRRELGDNFQKLLAATFAALPAGSIEVSDGPVDRETPFQTGLRDMNLVVILREVVERAELILETSERVAVFINTVSVNLVTTTLRSKTFPHRINADILGLILRVAKKSPGAKVWRKDVADAFNDPRFMNSPSLLVQHHWFPILAQWTMSDKERIIEILGRLYAPSSAGIMFGVGASAARLDADRKTQLNLRRIALVLLASPLDTHIEHLKLIEEKVVELFEASTTSSPSTAVKAELFMLIRALLLSVSAVHFAALWPIVNDNLKSALVSLEQTDESPSSQTNLSLLQACKLFDLLAATAPDDFQLLEWIYLTNTTDAVYRQDTSTSTALSDRLGVVQLTEQDDDTEREMPAQQTPTRSDTRRPMLVDGVGFDTEDIKAIAQETFANAALRPFLSQMSISLYESRYRMEAVDIAAFKRVLIDDLQDAATVVSA